ncbi:MAG: hypothetical protein Q8R18_05655 [bacterium]|nr:hypothetical protein [bacterium]
MVHKFPGTFTVVDGLDGIGKGVALQGIVELLKENGKIIFSLDHYWRSNINHPDFDRNCKTDAYVSLKDFDVIISSEPTYTQVGLAIREEVIAKNGRQYSAKQTAELYSVDRLILYKRVLLPALAAGKHVLQSRSVSTSLVYQSSQTLAPGERAISIEEIMRLEGNRFCLDQGPNLLIIPTIENVEEVMQRLSKRDKKDNAEFESLEFQMKIKPLYESSSLRDIFEDRGAIVKYLDAGISIEDTKRQAVQIYSEIFPHLFS